MGDLFDIAYAQMPLASKITLASLSGDSPATADALNDPFVRAVWSEAFSRAYEGGVEQFAETLSTGVAALDSMDDFQRWIAERGSTTKPTLELAYLRAVLTCETPTRAELHAAVICTVRVVGYLTAPAQYVAEMDAFFNEQQKKVEEARDSLTEQIEAYRARGPSAGGKKSAESRRKQRDDRLDRAAIAMIEIESDPRARATLDLIAEQTKIPLTTLRHIRLKKIAARAEKIRAEKSTYATRRRRQSKSASK